MKAINIIIIILAVLLLGGEEKNIAAPHPFKPALELTITELIDSLKNEIKGNKLLSIQFHFPDSHTDFRRGGEMSLCILDGYASANIDGYAKIDSTTIAIYNLKDDIFELVNKNEITFFTDTLFGFKDICVLELTGKEQFFYKIITEDNIIKVPYYMNFSPLMPLRKQKCPVNVSFTPPKEFWWSHDSLRAEENLKYHQNKVKYYRNKRPK